MKVSLNTIKQYTEVTLPVDDLVESINAQLGGVDEVIELGGKYDGIVIVRIVSARKHPNADKLTVCMVDDGGVVADVERDDDGYVQVVCGAPNVREGMCAVWLPPSVTVPSSFDDAEPFVLSARELRGVVSQGMLAAADEIAIGSDHNGIIELTEADLPPHLAHVKLAPGYDFASVFGLDDTIIDIENKMFTHRPDCFGQLGVAREIAGITGRQFSSPEWYTELPRFDTTSDLELTVTNDASDLAPRFMAVALRDVTVAPSPFWLQCELVRLGGKPINNIVDATNYIMLLTGQPTHAYDYDKLRGRALGVRVARDGEQLTLLNGKTYSLTPDDVVIVDGDGAVGLAGIMGGGNSEVSADTRNVVLECANFDMYAVRKTSMRHGVFTDALTRFNKGQSSLQQPFAMALLLRSVISYAGGVQASAVYDISGELQTVPPIQLSADFINTRLGLAFDAHQIAAILRNVEMGVAIEGDSMVVTAPYWRTDVQLPEDVVEEVGRLYGFDKLPRELPVRSIAPASRNAARVAKQRIRESLRRSGASEVLTYSFVHENVIKRAGQDVARAFRLGNALSPDLQYYRLSVLPSILDKVHGNIKAGYEEFTLFEIGKGHDKLLASDAEGLPEELEFVDAVYASKAEKDGAAYYYMRELVSQLGVDLGLDLRYTPIVRQPDDTISAPFDVQRSAIVETRQGDFIGIVGELKQEVLRAFKLPAYAAAMSLDFLALQTASMSAPTQYEPLSKYPVIRQDISLRAGTDVHYEQLFLTTWVALTEKADAVRIKLYPKSIYQAERSAPTKTTTFHIEFTSFDKTLTDDDIRPMMDHVAARAMHELGAERI